MKEETKKWIETNLDLSEEELKEIQMNAGYSKSERKESLDYFRKLKKEVK